MIDLRPVPVLLCCMLASAGCRTDFTAEKEAADSLINVLNKVNESSSSVDVRLVQAYMKDISSKCEKIQMEMTDTLELKQARQLVDFCSLASHFQSCLDRKQRIDEQTDVTRKQLFNLKTDMVENLADKDSTGPYIEEEFRYVQSLDDGIGQVLTELNGCFTTYTELKQPIDRLLIALPDISEQ